MPVTLELQRDGRLLVWKFSDPWTVDEVYPLYAQNKIYYDNSDRTIHSLVDLTKMKKIPSHVLGLRNNSTWHHPHAGFTVFFGTSTFTQSLINTIFRLVRFEKIKIFGTEAEAMAHLERLIAHDDAAVG